MKRLKILTTFLVCLLLCATNMMGQTSRGDKLFLEGQKLQKTMTLSSQNAAIKKFNQAKVAYTSTDKKSMCDNQISICNENIKRMKQPKPVKKDEEPKPEEKDSVVKEPVVQKRTDVELTLSTERLDFKSNPKGSTQSVKVNCNYDDWYVASKPDWVSIYITEDRKKFSVEVEENDTDDPRSGVVAIQCEDKIVNLVINQNKRTLFKKIKDNRKKR